VGLGVRCAGSALQSDFPRPFRSQRVDDREFHGRSDHRCCYGFLEALLANVEKYTLSAEARDVISRSDKGDFREP